MCNSYKHQITTALAGKGFAIANASATFESGIKSPDADKKVVKFLGQMHLALTTTCSTVGEPLGCECGYISEGACAVGVAGCAAICAGTFGAGCAGCIAALGKTCCNCACYAFGCDCSTYC